MNTEPKNVEVWAVDTSVKMPVGLKAYLESHDTNDCKSYKGTGTPTGVSLFALEKSVDDKYAKMAYGCSDDLRFNTTIVAVKQNDKWVLVQPTQYYSGNGDLPLCSAISKYSISKDAEPQCVDTKGAIQENANR